MTLLSSSPYVYHIWLPLKKSVPQSNKDTRKSLIVPATIEKTKTKQLSSSVSMAAGAFIYILWEAKTDIL